MSVPLDGLKIHMDEFGSLQMGELQHLHLDLTPIWLDLACGLMQQARTARDLATNAKQSTDDEAFAGAIEAEMRAGMLAIVAACTAVDAFYAGVCQHVVMPKRSTRGGSRWAIMAETFKRAARIGNQSFAELRDLLKELSLYRGRAVHSEGGAAAPAYHPAYNLWMDRRFVQFRKENAQARRRTATR